MPRVTGVGSEPARHIFVTGTDSALYHKWWDGSTWGPSLTGYDAMGGTISLVLNRNRETVEEKR
jgi:hypothetical protein